MGSVRDEVRVFGSLDDLPEVLKPGRYVVDGVEVVVHEPVRREELAYQLRKNKELAEKYGSKGWV